LRAYRRFLATDVYLLKADVNERSITHRFAVSVQEEFPDQNVDCEFNRQDFDHKKKLPSFKKTVETDDTKGITVYPDIIAHHRGTSNNLAVIEAKKSSSAEDCKGIPECGCDQCKLRAYKNDLGYRHAFFVIFPVDKELLSFSDEKLSDYVREV
jgi:hypothetical protein